MAAEPISAAEAFTPFTPEEWRRLERYATRTRKLYGCAFLQHGQTSWTVTWSGGHGTSAQADQEAHVREAVLLLRPLYLRKEAAGFLKVQAMVKRHAYERDTDEGRRAIEVVKAYTDALQRILAEPDIRLQERRVDKDGNVVHTEEASPRRVFEDFLYGEHFHEDGERIQRIGVGLPAEAKRFLFLSTARKLADLYMQFTGTPIAIMREPALRADA
jgi:hypothetical protein